MKKKLAAEEEDKDTASLSQLSKTRWIYISQDIYAVSRDYITHQKKHYR